MRYSFHAPIVEDHVDRLWHIVIIFSSLHISFVPVFQSVCDKGLFPFFFLKDYFFSTHFQEKKQSVE